MTQLVMQYSYLQVLDLLTTIAFLVHGVREGNPVVRWMLEVAPSPLGGLLMVKVLAIMLGIYCWRLGKSRLLTVINIFFAAIVAWNLVALIVIAAQRTAG